MSWQKGKSKPMELRQRISKTLTGRKCPEHSLRMMGRKHTIEQKEKLSNTLKEKYKNGWRREFKHSDSTKNRISIKLSGRKNPQHSLRMKGKKHSKEHNKKISLSNMGRKFSEETKKKMRNSMINHIKKYRGNVKPNIGKHEKQYLDFIEDSIGYPVIRQYPVNGYFLDGYCKERHLAIEIDERPKTNERDINRQQEVEQELNCSFLRINTCV